jgi:hypothetical protein
MAITYPIQETDRFTIYDTNAQAPLKDGNGKQMTSKKWGSEDKTQMIQGLADNIKWLIEVKAERPTFDPLTQKLKRLPVSYDVASETATTQSYEVVSLTQEEIDAKIPAHADIGGIKYDVSEQAQNAFTRMQSLIDHAGMALTDEVSVKDVLGVSHTITVETFNANMIQYGLHCYALFSAEPEPVDPDII